MVPETTDKETPSSIPAPEDPGKKPPADDPMATAMTFGQHVTDYAHRYGAVTGIALASLVLIGVIVKRIIRKKNG